MVWLYIDRLPHFKKPDSDPHQREKPDTDDIQSQKSDPDSHYCEKAGAVEPWRHNEAMEGHYAKGFRLASL
jgi:hypothetical protein